MVQLTQHRPIGPLLSPTVRIPGCQRHSSIWLTAWEDGTKLAYFRGRKLQGKVVKLPEQCRGVVVERAPEKDPKTATEEPVEDVDEEQEKTESMQITAEFDEMVVWGHESIADASADPYVRSMEEWLQVADQVWLDGTLTIVHMILILPDSLLFYLKTSHMNDVA